MRCSKKPTRECMTTSGPRPNEQLQIAQLQSNVVAMLNVVARHLTLLGAIYIETAVIAVIALAGLRATFREDVVHLFDDGTTSQ